MALEQINQREFLFERGPLGIHEHPRIFDAVVFDPSNLSVPEIDEHRVGKAGINAFSEVALRGGFVAMLAMPNESLRLPEQESRGQTKVVPYPISNRDRALAAANVIATQSNIPSGLIIGVDPVDVGDLPNLSQTEAHFFDTADLAMAAKIYGAETTGGYNVKVELIPELIRMFDQSNPGKPVVLHVEGKDVGWVLNEVHRQGGDDWPIHIAHVSSEEEMGAVIQAKQMGMNVTCEVTAHHMFLTDDDSKKPNGLGCMKPSLKKPRDVQYLQRYFKGFVDCIGTDCAPHAWSDKLVGAFGVASHPSVLNMFMNAALDDGQDWIDPDDVYEKLCVNTYRRFNFPFLGGQVVYNPLIHPPLRNNKYADTDPFEGLSTGAVTRSNSGQGVYQQWHLPLGGYKKYSSFVAPGRQEAK